MDYFSWNVCGWNHFVDGNGQLKNKKLTKEIATMVLSSFWNSSSVFSVMKGQELVEISKRQVKQGRSVVTVVNCNVGIPKGSMGRKVYEHLLNYHTNQLFM